MGPIGCNNNGLIDPLKATAQRNSDNFGLGFKKIPFHLGINKFIPKIESSLENESQVESNILEDSDDGEDPYPYPIPHDLAKSFVEPYDFVPRVNAMDSTIDSSEDTTNTHHTQPEQGESSQLLCIKFLCKNIGEEGEYVPITVGEFYSLSPSSTILENVNLTLF